MKLETLGGVGVYSLALFVGGALALPVVLVAGYGGPDLVRYSYTAPFLLVAMIPWLVLSLSDSSELLVDHE